jgi:hypothetical protein
MRRRADQRHQHGQQCDVGDAAAAHARAQRPHSSVERGQHPEEAQAARGSGCPGDAQHAGDAQYPQRGDQQGQSGQPVGAKVRELARREDELHEEVGDEDDPDDGARRLEKRCQPEGQVDREERQPGEAKQQERHLHPVFELPQDFEALALDRLRGGFQHVGPSWLDIVEGHLASVVLAVPSSPPLVA